MSESNPTPPANPESERLFDLLADHTLGLLTPDEFHEMTNLLEDHPELQDDALEEAAALLLVADTVASTGEADLPAGLSDKLAADVERFVVQPSNSASTDFSRSDPTAPETLDKQGGRGVLAFIGGAVIGAVAASILVALILTLPDNRSEPGPINVAARYQEFIQTTADVATYPWSIMESGYEQVNGEITWSGNMQWGYMVLDQLPINDPAAAQYQLWIVDPTRDEFPVDGGVFNVADHLADDGKAYVPIDAKLRVDQPAAFAITLEQPGGVVKSNNALLVVAAVP
ncbi:MAG: anti-sigma factor [Planctomycetota bacterium]